MKILAMDTATGRGSVALLEGGVLVGEEALPLAPGQVATLPVVVEQLLLRVGWGWGDLELLVVTLGPGSFTGVRIALGMAKGIVLAHGMPLVGVSTLQVLASGAGDGLVLSVLDARREEVFAGLYRVESGWPQLVGDVVCLPYQEVGQFFSDRVRGSVVKVVGEEEFLRGLDFPAAWSRQGAGLSARVLGQVGEVCFDRCGGDGLLEPLYVRPSEAESKRIVV